MRNCFRCCLIVVISFLLATSLFSVIEIRVSHAQHGYSVTIWAWDNYWGWLSEPITMDEVPTGFSTPHTFETDDLLPHTFTVPLTNSHGTRFSKWDTGVVRTTIGVGGTGTYTALYDATPYDATISAWDSVYGSTTVSIIMDNVATGFTTPHTFTLQGMHTFTAQNTDAHGGSFMHWFPAPPPPNWGESPTTEICSGGTYTAEYQGPPYDVTIWAWDSVMGWLSQPIDMDGSPSGFSTPHTFTIADEDTLSPHVFTVPSNDTYDTKFTKWSTGETSTSITINYPGTYTAQYYVWWTEAVDASSSDIGRGSSIALDSYGRPHVAYIDYSSDSLKYASWTGSVGGVGVWDIETVDSGGNIRYNTASLALDSSDVPHISYSNGYLMYATKGGGFWSKQTVDSINSADGRWCSIELDSDGYPHICYVADSGDLYVKYAWWTGSTWTTEYVTNTGYTGFKFTSLALDSLGKPHACWFFSGGGFTSPTVYYANKTGSTWGTPVAVAPGLTSTSGYCSIALDSLDNPCIAYYDEYFDPYTSKGSLKLARWTGASWSVATVDAPELSNQDWVGQYTCLVMDYMGRPHISYYESWWTGSTTAGILKYAWWTGSSWFIETADPTWNVGKWSSVVVDAGGKVHISYYDETNKCLKYARRSPLLDFDSHEYFFQVYYDALDTDGDGQDNAIKVTMDVDSTYGGTQRVTVLTVLRDPFDTNCAYNYSTWPITGALLEYGEAIVYAPPGSISGLYDVILILYDNGNHFEDQIIEESVAYLYPSVAFYSVTIWTWDSAWGWPEEPITMDGVPTGFESPHTFADLTGTHTFTVPDIDEYGNPFVNWTTGETSTTITVSSGGTYIAQYYYIPPTLALENVQTWYWTSHTYISSVARGDVDGDGQTEIVTGGYYFDYTREVAQLCVWNGATLALENVKAWYWTDYTVIRSVAVGDVDADGKTEIVTGGDYFDGVRYVAQLCVWDGSTLALENVQVWYWTSNTSIDSVAIGDVDGDAAVEIVTGGYYDDVSATHRVAQLCVWDGASLTLENVKTWYWVGDTFIYSVAVGDVDGDAQIEIVTGGYYDDGTRWVAQLCVWTGSNLALEDVTAWYWVGDTVIYSVAVGDVDGDAQTEIVTGGYYIDGGLWVAQLCVWSGSSLACENVTVWYWTSHTCIYSVAVADVDGDGQTEIVTGGVYTDSSYIAQLCVWDGGSLTLENVKTWFWVGATGISSVAVGDVDGDAQIEIVTGGGCTDGTRYVAQLVVWAEA